LHPRYNEQADYASFEDALPPHQLPPVVLGPWVPVHYKTDELLVMRRNPYYWKVDEKGRQLPYLDEVIFEKGTDGVKRTLNTLAGSGDHTNVENPSTFIETLRRAGLPDAPFRLSWGPELLAFSLLVNLSADLGVKDQRDRELRTLFRDTRFRRALSHAIDREGLCNAIVRGGLLRPWPGGLMPGSPYFDRESAVYYPYAPETTAMLLAELGFRDTDGNGFVNWTRGPLAGEDLALVLITSSDSITNTEIAKGLTALLMEAGLKINFRPMRSTGIRDAGETGRWELMVDRMEPEFAVPFTRADELVPLGRYAPFWHRQGKEPRQLLSFEKELVRVVRQFRREPDIVERRKLMRRYNSIFTEHLYGIGILVGRHGLGLGRRLRNVPAGAMSFLYQWSTGNVVMEQLWVPAEEQLPQVMPEHIPEYR